MRNCEIRERQGRDETAIGGWIGKTKCCCGFEGLVMVCW